MTAFTYNWASELNTTFDKQLHRLINWSNARCHLTYCLLSQKMGLYHHTLFTDINKGKESKDMNPFCLSANDKDMSLLISYPAPYVPDRERAVPRSMPPSPSILVFDEVLRDVTPPRPLYRTSYSHNRDLVKRHGYQFQEVRQVQIKKAILAQNLEELYIMWQRRPPHVHITEDKIETLKRSSRLIHYCAAPLLFHPEWRKLRSSTGSEHSTVTPDEPSSEEKKQETKERKTSKVQKTIDEMKNEKTAVEAEKKLPTEEAWHKELRSAYLQQYVQYMQSLHFIVVQTRPQSPKQSRRHLGRGAVTTKPKRETSPADLKKKSSSKDRKDSLPKTLQCYLQKTSHGGIMLMELVFQGCFFIVRLYALGCSQIPSGKTVAVQICRMFVEDCNRYREYIHLLSFNYDFHLCKAQLYLNGSQRIFNKGYGVTHMLKGLLQEYLNSPVFARNRLGYGEISVPLHPGVTPQVVFNYLVKNASFYDFSTLPVKTTNASSSNTDRVLTHILREYNDYDVSFVLSLKETNEEGVVTLEYIVLMTSRREIFPKLTLDLRLTKKSPSAGSLSTVSSGSRTVGLPEYGETEQGIASRVRFNLPTGSSQGIPSLPSLGEFHRSASSPHSLYALGHEVSSKILNVTSSRSDEKIGDYHRNVLPPTAPIPEHYEEELPENVALPESTLLKEASLRGRDHLVHIICRAQTHCNRDLLWHRLLAGETGDEEKDGGKKSRRKSVMRKSNSETSLKQSWAKSLDTLSPGADQMSPSRLTFEDFKQLLSVVGSKSLREEDSRLISLLSMRAAWFQSLFRVICAKFPDEHRLFTDEDHLVHYLAVLNRDFPNMFVLLYVDEHNDSADISVVFREDLPDNKESSHRSRLLKKEVRSHVYGVINAVCFHLWTGLLPV